MMRCEDIQVHLANDLKNPLNPALPEAFAKHLETCAECRELQDLWQALGEAPMPPPDQGLSTRFRERLRRELSGSNESQRVGLAQSGKAHTDNGFPDIRNRVPHRLSGWSLPLAAAALLMIGGGFAAGYVLRGEAEPSNPRQATLARLRRGTAAGRMQTIALVTSPRGGDPNLVEALLDRVMQDPNLHVRLSAVEALYIFGSDPCLGQQIAEALPRQERPEVQLALVDLMVALREHRAAEALRRLLRDERLAPEVRHRAEARMAEQRM